MIVLGLILLLVGYLVGIQPLVTLGFVLLIIGIVLLVLGTAGPVGGRWY
jgi:hypothetical protein